MQNMETLAAEVRTLLDEILATKDPFLIRSLKYVTDLTLTFSRLNRQGYLVRFRGNGLQSRLVIDGGKHPREEEL